MEIPFWRALCVCMFACVCACVCYLILGCCMDGDYGGGNPPLQAGSRPQWEGGCGPVAVWALAEGHLCGGWGSCAPGECFVQLTVVYSHTAWALITLTTAELYRALPGSSDMHELCDLRQATHPSVSLSRSGGDRLDF